MKRKTWRDIVGTFKRQTPEPEEEPLPKIQVYECSACSQLYFHVGGEPQTQCRVCGRHALVLDRRAMEIGARREKSVRLLYAGFERYRQGDIDGAMREWEAAVDADPTFNEPHYNLGEIHLQRREVEKGIAATRCALALHEADANAHVNLGAGLSMQEKTEEALVEYKRAIEIDPNNLMAHFNRGLLLLRAGRIAESVPDWRKCIELAPQSEQAAYGRDVLRQFDG